MNLSLRSPSSEFSVLFVEGLHQTSLNRTNNNNYNVKTSSRVGHSAKNSDVYRRGGRNGISCHLMSGPLEESFAIKKHIKDPPRKLEFVRTLLIDNYDSYTYNIFQELSVINGVPPVVIKNDSWTWKETCHYLFEENAFDNIVISPGPGSPTCSADVGICLQILLECSEIPILGICLGHQALGYVHGAHIVHADEPVHGRLSEVEHNGCRLFSGIPSGKNSGFKVVRYHSLVIDADTLPEDLLPIALTSSKDALPLSDGQNTDLSEHTNDHAMHKHLDDDLLISRDSSMSSNKSRKVIMGVRHCTRPHYGVQFHPESVATCYGQQIFKNFRDITEEYWMKCGPSFFRHRNTHYNGLQVPNMNNVLRQVGSRINPFLGTSNDYILQDAIASADLLYNVHEEMSPSMSSEESCSCSSLSLKLLRLRWRKIDRIARRVGGAKNIFCQLLADHGAENTFWLDSSSTEKGRARFSFMGAKGGALWKKLTFRLSESSTVSNGGGHLVVEDGSGNVSSTFLKDGFFDFLNKKVVSFRCEEKDFDGLPFDFCGGYVGYIGYDLKVECGGAPNRHKSTTPDACLFFADNLIVMDHMKDDIYLLSLHDQTTEPDEWLDKMEKKLLNLTDNQTSVVFSNTSSSTSTKEFNADKSKVQYLEDVDKCLDYIRDGESYELCLTTQIRKDVGEKMDSLGLYLYMRENNPAPYAAWFNFGNENLCICCSSPERFLKLDSHGVLEAKPIKGTIARGANQEQDQQLKLKLQYSEKEQAENLMIVDLLRNDLGRVCEPGSVHVPSLMEVESYATVHTMVSTIRGKKRSDVSAIGCVQAAFPGGSMTGAPKLRSMEILDTLESSSRGIYSGCIGFFSVNQTFDLNIVIRTVVIHEGEASVGAGGAIVALSNPEDEYQEMKLKTRAPRNAVMRFCTSSLLID